jgi:hypothetical protein
MLPRRARPSARADPPHSQQVITSTLPPRTWYSVTMEPRLRAWCASSPALAAGEAGRAREVAVAVTGVASRNQVPWMTGTALRCQGLAAHAGRCKPISRTCSPSFISLPAPSSPPRRPGAGGNERGGGNGPGCPLSPGAGGRRRHHKVRAAPMTAGTPARQAQSACPATCPGSAPISAPPRRALVDRDISQLADACQAGAAPR